MQTIRQYIKLVRHRIRLQFMCMDISCILVRIGWILFFLLGAYEMGFSQDSNAKFNKTVDYVNCEFARQSLKDHDNAMYLKYIAKFPNCQNTSDKFASELYAFLTENNMSGTVKLCQEINALKKDYNKEFVPGDEVDNEDIYNVIKNKIFNMPAVKSFQSGHQSSFASLKSNITRQLEMTLIPELITESSENSVTSNPSDNNRYLQAGNEAEYDYEEVLEQDKSEEEYAGQDYGQSGIISRRDILWLFSLLMFGLLAFYFIRSVMPRYTVNQNYQSLQIDDDKTKDLLEKLSKQVQDLRNEHNDLIEELQVLSHRYNKLDRSTDISKTAADVLQENIEHSLDDFPEEEAEEEMPVNWEIFFMPLPNREGSFNMEDALEEFKRTDTVYEFKLMDGSQNQAEFKVFEDVATMLRALDDPDTYLKPACRSNAIIPISATKIITDEKGIAVLRHGEWKILKKALIHYV